MYMDDTTMYMDILSFGDNKLLEMESNKLPLLEPTDPWLVDQAGISDTQFPVTNTSSSTSVFGRLSPTMEQFANSLLPNEMTLPIEDTFDVDVALDCFTTQNDDNLGVALESLVLEPQNQYPQVTTPRRRSKRLSTKDTYMASYPEPDTSAGLHLYPAQDLGTPVNQSSAWSCAGNADGDHDSSEGAKVQRKRRPRVSYSTLTEDQKYQRIRDLNNEASRLYRERTREQLTSLQEMETKETERNRVLRIKAEGLEKLRDEIKAFTFNFFKEHVGNSGTQ